MQPFFLFLEGRKKKTKKNSKLLSTHGQEQYITVSATRVAGSTRSKCNSTGNLCCLMKSGPRPANYSSLVLLRVAFVLVFRRVEMQKMTNAQGTAVSEGLWLTGATCVTHNTQHLPLMTEHHSWLMLLWLLRRSRRFICTTVLVIDDFLLGLHSSQLSGTTHSVNRLTDRHSRLCAGARGSKIISCCCLERYWAWIPHVCDRKWSWSLLSLCTKH